MRAADGRATGLLRENAQDLVERSIADYIALQTPETIQQPREQVQPQAILRCPGITSFHDAGASFEKSIFSAA